MKKRGARQNGPGFVYFPGRTMIGAQKTADDVRKARGEKKEETPFRISATVRGEEAVFLFYTQPIRGSLAT